MAGFAPRGALSKRVTVKEWRRHFLPEQPSQIEQPARAIYYQRDDFNAMSFAELTTHRFR